MRPHTLRRSSRRVGYSLVEILVAIVLIDAGLLAIVQTNAVVVRRRNEIRARAGAVAAAASRVEQLIAGPCVPASGAFAAPAYDETWLVRPSLRIREVSDSVTFGAGVGRRIALRTIVPC